MENFFTRIHAPRPLSRPISQREILEIQQDRDLRIEEKTLLKNLQDLAMKTRRVEIHDWYKRELEAEFIRLERDPDPFRRNLPTLGQCPFSNASDFPLMYYRPNEWFSIPLGRRGTNQNVLVVGPTGFGKSNFIKLLIIAFSGRAITIVFSPKGDLELVGKFGLPGDTVVLDPKADIRLSFSDCSAFLSHEELISKTLEILDPHLQLGTSVRLLAGILQHIDPRRLCPSEIISQLEKIDAARTSSLGGSRDQLSYKITGFVNRTGQIFESQSSNFLEEVFSRPQTIVVKTGGLTNKDASLIASWTIHYIYEKRRIEQKSNPPVVFFLDDAMPIVYGTRTRESEGRTVPIATWSFMGRSLGLGLVVGAQNYSLISPSLRNNTSTVVCLGAFGEDQTAISQFMGLDSEQAAILPTLPRGEAVAIARNQWPMALRGYVPEVV